MTASSSLAHCSRSGVGSERLLFSQKSSHGSLGSEVKQACSHVAPLPGVTESSSQLQVNSGSWTPLHTCLLLLLLAGRQTVILLIAFTTAKPPGQKSHLEKWTESSAHRLRIPQTTSPRSQPSCKRKTLWLWKSTSEIRCHNNHV